MNPCETEDIVMLTCRHCYCRSCLNMIFEVGLASRMKFPPHCCGTGIALDSVRSLLRAELIDRYGEVKEEFGSKDPTHCAKRACGVFLPVSVSVKYGDFGLCPQCGEETCIKCKNLKVSHESPAGQCPENAVASECKDLLEKGTLRRCPKCQYVLEKSEGCRFMR